MLVDDHAVFRETLVEIISRPRADDSILPHENLSNHEYQVMERLVAGVGVSKIADEMSLSVTTISTYRKRLLDKLGVASISEV